MVDSPVDADDTTGIGPAVSIRPRIVDLGSPVAPSLRAAIWMPAAPMSLPINALARGDTDSAWGCRSSAGSCNICGAKLKLGNHPAGGLWARVIVSRHRADLH